MYIRWTPELETGQPLIDAEHKLLVMLFRKLDVAIKSQLPDKVIGDITHELRRFVEFHFVSEENLMRETDYPERESHHARHTELLHELSAMLAKVASHREYPEDLLSFLNDWLVRHIGAEDQRLAQHVSTSAARPIAEFIYPEFIATTR